MSIGRNSIYNVIGSVTPLVLALVTVPLYLNAVGTERYGALAIAWLILGYFGLFDLGLGRAVAQRIAALVNSDAQHRARVFWTAVIVNIGMGVIGGALLYFGAHYFFQHMFSADDWLKTEVLTAVPYLSLAVPVATLTGVASGALQGREKFLDVNIVTVIGASLFQLIPLAVAYIYGPTLKWLIIAAIVARFIGFFIFYIRVHHHLLKGYAPKFDRTEWLALLKYGGWITITSIIGPLLVVVDRFMIGAIITAVAVTIYTIPFDIVQRISILPRSIAMALFPKMAMLNNEDGAALAKRATQLINVIISPIILAAIYMITPLLTLWIGSDIAVQAGPVGMILLLGWWINAYAIIPYTRLQAYGRPDLVAITHLLELPIYIAILYYSLLNYGLLGASAAFSMRTCADYFILNKLSMGKWFISRSLLVIAGVMVTSIIVNFYFIAFSMPWFLFGLLSSALLILLIIRETPNELKPILGKFLPKPILNLLHFV